MTIYDHLKRSFFDRCQNFENVADVKNDVLSY